MPRMAHVYRITFAQTQDQQTVLSEPVEVTVLAPSEAHRFARRYLKLDESWQLHRTEDLGRWDQQPN